MPNTTKYLLAEQVQMRLEGGYPDIAQAVQRPDLYKAIEQKINAMYKMSQFSINLPSGGTIPDNMALATYEDIEVTRTSNERCKCTLPVMPISLPRNAGINEIRPVLNLVDSGDRMLGNPLIPMQAGQNFLLQADKLLNNLLGQWSYEVNGKTIIINKDITVFGITTVDMKLVVFDMNEYSETDVLPIPADSQEQIVKELVNEFAGVVPESGIVNKTTTLQNIAK